MSCDKFAEMLSDYCERSLSTKDLAFAREHLELCPACKSDVEMWQKLAALPSEQPSISSRARFEHMLSAYQEGRWEKSTFVPEKKNWLAVWVRSSFSAPLTQSAFALCLLLVGFVAGERFTTKPVNTPTPQLSAMQTELTNLRQMVALSLLEQQSASRRLEGVSYSTQVERPDPEISAALLHALRFDSSVDVRLAALDALKRYSHDPTVRQGLLTALQEQQSPLVQIALIDLFVDMRESDAKDHLRRIEQDAHANSSVRQRAQWGIQQLS